MSDFLDDIGEYLAGNGIGQTTTPSDIFIGVWPADPNSCVGVFGLPGDQPSSDIADFIYPRFQILVRDPDYDTASAKVAAIRALLHVKIGLQLDNFYVLRCHAAQEGQPIGEDSNGRSEFSINFRSQARSS